MTTIDVPPYTALLWPTLVSVRALGGSASIDEIVAAVIDRSGLSLEQQQVLHGNGPQTKVEYRLAWARTYLKMMGLLTNSSRGIWSLTELGREVSEDRIAPLLREVVRKQQVRRKGKRRGAGVAHTTEGDLLLSSQREEVSGWRDQILEALLQMTPDAFERLAQRLLREAGFTSATVTGRSGDGGIDGLGTYRLSLLSFPVFFQCKRYRGSVGAGAVRDFRGAMAGRGDKGLLITTGSFTAEARVEATRDGAPPVDLIDGGRLTDLLKQYEIGVSTETRLVEDVVVDPQFFADL